MRLPRTVRPRAQRSIRAGRPASQRRGVIDELGPRLGSSRGIFKLSRSDCETRFLHLVRSFQTRTEGHGQPMVGADLRPTLRFIWHGVPLAFDHREHSGEERCNASLFVGICLRTSKQLCCGTLSHLAVCANPRIPYYFELDWVTQNAPCPLDTGADHARLRDRIWCATTGTEGNLTPRDANRNDVRCQSGAWQSVPC